MKKIFSKGLRKGMSVIKQQLGTQLPNYDEVENHRGIAIQSSVKSGYNLRGLAKAREEKRHKSNVLRNAGLI